MTPLKFVWKAINEGLIKTAIKKAAEVAVVETAKASVKGIVKGGLLGIQNLLRTSLGDIFEKVGKRATELNGEEPKKEYDVNLVNVLNGITFTMENLKKFHDKNQIIR